MLIQVGHCFIIRLLTQPAKHILQWKQISSIRKSTWRARARTCSVHGTAHRQFVLRIQRIACSCLKIRAKIHISSKEMGSPDVKAEYLGWDMIIQKACPPLFRGTFHYQAPACVSKRVQLQNIMDLANKLNGVFLVARTRQKRRKFYRSKSQRLLWLSQQLWQLLSVRLHKKLFDLQLHPSSASIPNRKIMPHFPSGDILVKEDFSDEIIPSTVYGVVSAVDNVVLESP